MSQLSAEARKVLCATTDPGRVLAGLAVSRAARDELRKAGLIGTDGTTLTPRGLDVRNRRS